jgi:hypothetical protein
VTELLEVTSGHPLNKTFVTCSSRTFARRNNDGFTPRFGFGDCTADHVFWKILDGRKAIRIVLDQEKENAICLMIKNDST